MGNPPPPDPSPKGGALVLTFAFVPLSALARERSRVRSLGLSADRQLSGTTLAGFSPNPFPAVGTCMPTRGNPRRGSPTAKLSTGQILPTLLRFLKKPPKTMPDSILLGDLRFRSLRAATKGAALGTCGLLRKGRRNLFRSCLL